MASSTKPWGAPGSLVFVSDVHLDDSCPERSLLFSSFLSRIARPPRPAALYVLGDLFDVWLGRYSLRTRAHAPVLREFRALTRSGVEIYVVSGNRDFLLDGHFGEKTGAAV